MKRPKIMVLSCLFFIAMLFAEVYCFLEYRDDLFTIVGIGVVLLISAYLMLDSIFSHVSTGKAEKESPVPVSDLSGEREAKQEEADKLLKATYLLHKKGYEALESRLSALEEILGKNSEELKTDIMNAAKIQVKYDRENAKQIVLNHKKKVDQAIAQSEFLEKELLRQVKEASSELTEIKQAVNDYNQEANDIRKAVHAVLQAVEKIEFMPINEGKLQYSQDQQAENKEDIYLQTENEYGDNDNEEIAAALVADTTIAETETIIEPVQLDTAPSQEVNSAVSDGPMSQDDIAALFAEMDQPEEPVKLEADPDPAPVPVTVSKAETQAPAKTSDGPMSQDEIAALLASMNQSEEPAKPEASKPEPVKPAPEPVPAPKPAAPAKASDGPMSQDEIAALLASMNQSEEPAKPEASKPEASKPEPVKPASVPAPKPAAPTPAKASDGPMSQDEIAALLASMNQSEEPVKPEASKPEPVKPAPAPVSVPKPAAPAPAKASDGPMSQDDIAALLASMNQTEEPANPEPKPEPVKPEPALGSDPNKALSPDEIAALFASLGQ